MNENKIQCLECWKYYHRISNTHLKKCCGLTCKQYNERYPDALLYSDYCRNKMIESHKGKKHTEKRKQKISNSLKGIKFTDERKQNMKNASKKSFENGKRVSPNKGKKLSDDHKKKIGDGNRGKKCTSEQKINYRKGTIKRIENRKGQIYPNYNSDGCNFFNWLNKEFNLNGHHAENGGEYFINKLGYWVDYYEPELNLVIEWDERLHYNYDGKLKKKDIQRQKEIEKYFGCKFIRVKNF